MRKEFYDDLLTPGLTIGEQIEAKLDDLRKLLGGFRANQSADDLLEAAKEDEERCVKLIAEKMGLPVKIRLHREPPSPGKPPAFVALPPKFPPYGSKELEGFPVDMTFTADCSGHPERFVTLALHETAHILLDVIRGKHNEDDEDKNEEKYTDLVPIVLGYADVVRKGRQYITEKGLDGVGYLLDSEFRTAVEYTRKGQR